MTGRGRSDLDVVLLLIALVIIGLLAWGAHRRHTRISTRHLPLTEAHIMFHEEAGFWAAKGVASIEGKYMPTHEFEGFITKVIYSPVAVEAVAAVCRDCGALTPYLTERQAFAAWERHQDLRTHLESGLR